MIFEPPESVDVFHIVIIAIFCIIAMLLAFFLMGGNLSDRWAVFFVSFAIVTGCVTMAVGIRANNENDKKYLAAINQKSPVKISSSVFDKVLGADSGFAVEYRGYIIINDDYRVRIKKLAAEK